MAVTVFGSGTLTTSVGTTPQELASINQAGVYVLYTDLIAMAPADVVELTVNAIVLTGGTKRGLHFAQFTGTQLTGAAMKVSPALANDLTDADALEFNLTHRFGTAISVPWKVLKVN